MKYGYRGKYIKKSIKTIVFILFVVWWYDMSYLIIRIFVAAPSLPFAS